MKEERSKKREGVGLQEGRGVEGFFKEAKQMVQGKLRFDRV